MRLKDMLKVEHCKIGINAKSKDDILHELAEFLSTSHKGIIDKEGAYKSLKERENKGSTGIGKGLAVPHGQSDKLNGIALIIAYDKNGKDFNSYDNRPTHLFFVGITSSEYNPNDHLKLLKIIAAIFEKSNIAQQLETVKEPADIYNLIIKKEEEILYKF
ncbi:MAG TPA: PTS sugar transporter subunit IIA [Spirochaetota bacterium]|nr:PTS sugar transporter subunit IIA [Spirochaetota bacterium]HOS33015.1 PTS sugar transporter subunit IIA [Spirochaetota bacterium]HOS55368.1 PTS sugar transporter subunit IIA [Spirochaetota bacterium]HPK62912.1 PTS sugar transporter subunit IIA [Spirochaetota bacterium]HQF77879.1 PTS sugar transporter subunit IIA [Spirochaetota bacterium]